MSLEVQDTQKLVRNLWDDADLMSGGDSRFTRGLCVMQAVDYVAGTGGDYNVTDHPACVHSLLSDYFIRLNDGAVQKERNRLRPFIPRLIGTVKEDVLAPHQKENYDHAPEGVDYAQILFEEQDIEIKKLLNGRTKGQLSYDIAYQLGGYELITSKEKNLSGKLYSGQKLYRALLKEQQGITSSTHNLDLTPILQLLDRVLPPAKEYKLVAGKKVNVIERVQKLVSRIRQKKGINTEWQHEAGIAEIVELS